jgi:hypothetical protein
VWWWIAAALFWWRACGETLGVPNALVLSAGRDAGDAALFDALARRMVARTGAAWRKTGPFLVALAAFSVAFAAVLALTRRDPFAAAVVCLLAPAAAHGVWTRRAALAMAEAPPEAEALRARFLRLRAGAFLAAMVSAGAATLLGRFGLP